MPAPAAFQWGRRTLPGGDRVRGAPGAKPHRAVDPRAAELGLRGRIPTARSRLAQQVRFRRGVTREYAIDLMPRVKKLSTE
jgi:hypothetical protein